MASLLLAACQTTPQAAETLAQAPTSIARPPGHLVPPETWTTSAEPEISLLKREGAGRARRPSEIPLLRPAAPERLRMEPGTSGEPSPLATAAPWRVSLAAQGTHVWGGDPENGGRGPGLWLGELRLSLSKPLDYFGKLSLGFAYTRAEYAWSGTNAILAGTDRPFHTAHQLRATANLFQPFHEEWAAVLTLAASVGAEEGADLVDGFSWSVTGGVGHRVSDALDLGAGFIVSKTFGDGIFVIGGPQFTWRPSEQVTLELEGSTLDLSYRPNRVWEWGVGGGFSSLRFRQRKDGPGAGGIIGDSRLPIYARLRYRGQRALDLELRAGIDAWRYITVEDERGLGEYSVELDPAPFVSLRATLRL